MIEVSIYYKESVIKGFTVTGHAGFAAKGEDIVCAAVSAVTQTALLGMLELLGSKPLWKIEEQGYLECWLPSEITPEEEKKAQIILQTMEFGLRNIQVSHEQFLTVRKRRWNKCCSQ